MQMCTAEDRRSLRYILSIGFCSALHSSPLVPSNFKNARDAFGNLRVDETDPDVPSSDRFSVVLEAIDYDTSFANDGETLNGVYGAAGSGGRVVSGTLEFLAEGGVFRVEYVPFVAGTHLLNVTFQVQQHTKQKSRNCR